MELYAIQLGMVPHPLVAGEMSMSYVGKGGIVTCHDLALVARYREYLEEIAAAFPDAKIERLKPGSDLRDPIAVYAEISVPDYVKMMENGTLMSVIDQYIDAITTKDDRAPTKLPDDVTTMRLYREYRFDGPTNEEVRRTQSYLDHFNPYTP